MKSRSSVFGSCPSGRLKNLKDVDKWSSLSLCLSVRDLRALAVLVQSDGLNSTLSPVVYGDIAPSINTEYKIPIQWLGSGLQNQGGQEVKS